MTWWLAVLEHVSILFWFSCVCLSVCPAAFVCVCLFVNAGAEDEVGLPQRCPGRGWCRPLAPSISVSVPQEEPCNSDEEYYEHPLFSSQWAGSSTRPRATVKSTEVLLGHDEGELSTVPFGSSCPLLTCHPFHSLCAWDCCLLGRETQLCFLPRWKWCCSKSLFMSRQSCSMSSFGVSVTVVPS